MSLARKGSSQIRFSGLSCCARVAKSFGYNHSIFRVDHKKVTIPLLELSIIGILYSSTS